MRHIAKNPQGVSICEAFKLCVAFGLIILSNSSKCKPNQWNLWRWTCFLELVSVKSPKKTTHQPLPRQTKKPNQLRWTYSSPQLIVQLEWLLVCWILYSRNWNAYLYVNFCFDYRRCTNFNNRRRYYFSASKYTELFKKTGGWFLLK